MQLTKPSIRLTVSVEVGGECRCPICGTLFIERLNGSSAEVTCKDRNHKDGGKVRIEFITQ